MITLSVRNRFARTGNKNIVRYAVNTV